MNFSIEPLLSQPDATGVVATSVPADSAASCAAYLREHWVDGKLPLTKDRTCTGYSSYGKTLSAHDAKQQKDNTLLFTNAQLPATRAAVPGFHAIEVAFSHKGEDHCDVVEPLKEPLTKLASSVYQLLNFSTIVAEDGDVRGKQFIRAMRCLFLRGIIDPVYQLLKISRISYIQLE